jgi:hypothetical protein
VTLDEVEGVREMLYKEFSMAMILWGRTKAFIYQL